MRQDQQPQEVGGRDASEEQGAHRLAADNEPAPVRSVSEGTGEQAEDEGREQSDRGSSPVKNADPVMSYTSAGRTTLVTAEPASETDRAIQNRTNDRSRHRLSVATRDATSIGFPQSNREGPSTPRHVIGAHPHIRCNARILRFLSGWSRYILYVINS